MQIQIFSYYDQSKIRTIFHNGESWWIVVDICAILGIQNPTDAIAALETDEKNNVPFLDAMGRTQNYLVVNESGLYSLIFRSNKPEAKKFRHWVTSDVLPQIRKTGFYGRISPFHVFVRRFNENYPRLDRGYFSIISELYVYVYGKLEMLGYIIPEVGIHNREIRPDVSVGKLFPQWLKKHYPDKEQEFKTYQHKLPDGTEVYARQYRNELLPLFIEYIETDWIPTQAQRYFQERDPNAIPFLPKLIEAVK